MNGPLPRIRSVGTRGILLDEEQAHGDNIAGTDPGERSQNAVPLDSTEKSPPSCG